jgi:hypothetical protein
MGLFSSLSPIILPFAMQSEILKQTPVAYITRDLERALGVPEMEGFVIMTNDTPFGKSVAATRGDVHLIAHTTLLDTHELLGHPQTLILLQEKGIRHILVFKPTAAIERIAAAHQLTVLNPLASLASSIEEKITQLSFLEELKDVFLPFTVSTLKDVSFLGTPFVLQFNHSHTGSGTLFIQSEKELNEWQEKFPLRPVRIAPFISGPLFTNNNVVAKKGTLVGNINYQITGLTPFTNNPFATIGNDWAIPHQALTNEEQKQYQTIATRVGTALQKRGWKGLFGIDVLQDAASRTFFLLEINARQPASATFESFLQKQSGVHITTMEAHLLALLDEEVEGELQTITEGAQMTQKVIPPKTAPMLQAELTGVLRQKKFTVTPYLNLEPEQDWLRIQTLKGGFMKTHRELNEQGKDVQKTIEHYL